MASSSSRRLLLVAVAFLAAIGIGSGSQPAASADSALGAVVWLDALPHDGIADPFGPPRANASFGEAKLKIASRSFEHGLGTHAP